MASISEIRQQYPQYDDLSDQELADALYRKHYSDMDRAQFDKAIGLAPDTPAPSTPANDPATPDQPKIGIGETIARGAAQGATFNLADEIAGGGAQKQAMTAAATDRDMLAELNAAAEAKDWDRYRDLQKQILTAGDAPAQQRRDEYRARDEMAREQNPKSYLGGEVLGAVGTGMGAAKGGLSLTAKAAQKSLVPRIAAGMAEGGAYGAAYGAGGAEEGERLSGAASGGAIGTVAGGAIPAAGAGYRAVKDKTVSAVRSTFRPTSEAQSRVASAMARDAGKTALNQGDEAIAAANAQPVMNVDRGGETTRALARASANASPEVRSELTRATSDRFASQGDRATRLLEKVTGGRVDDLALQDSIRDAAKVSNKVAYDRAMKSPQAQQVYTPKLQQLMQAPAIRSAAKSVPSKSANRTLNDIPNPFEKNSAGQYVLRQKADGTLVSPNLGFWDQVKRNLDSEIGKAQRAGDRPLAADLTNLKKQLVDELDSIVPAYKTARAGAAAAFGAEDAVDAGRNFARATRNTPEMKRALGNMTDAEKRAFQTGFASEMVDKIKSTRDRSNVITSMFGNQEAREKMTLAFGPQKAREIEAFVRIEGAMDLARGMLGNSTTARQLVELGLISGGGATYGSVTGDWKTAGMIAGAGALRYGRAKIDQNVLREIGEILVSGDEAKMAQAIAKAGTNSKFLNTLRAATDEIYKVSPPVVGMGAAALTEE